MFGFAFFLSEKKKLTKSKNSGFMDGFWMVNVSLDGKICRRFQVASKRREIQRLLQLGWGRWVGKITVDPGNVFFKATKKYRAFFGKFHEP